MERIMNFDKANPREDMNPNEKAISDAGGSTQQKAEETSKPKAYYNPREAYETIGIMSEEDFNKMGIFEQSVFSKYGLDIRQDVDLEKYSSMTQENVLDRLKVLEALILITMKYKNSSPESLRDYTKLYEDYKSEIKRYEKLYNKVYEPSGIQSVEEAEDFLYKYMNPNNIDSSKKFFNESSGKLEEGYTENKEKNEEVFFESINSQISERVKSKTLKPEEVFEEDLV